MCKKTGFCGSVFVCLLVVINAILFKIGAALFVIGAILKWSDLLNTVKNDLLNAIGPTSFDVIDTTIIIFLVTGGFIVVVSFVGLLGTCCSSRPFLIIFELLVCLLFIANIIIFIILIVKANDFEVIVRKEIQITIKKITDSITGIPLKAIQTESILSKASCPIVAYAGTTKYFKCCDLNSTQLALSDNIRGNFVCFFLSQ